MNNVIDNTSHGIGKVLSRRSLLRGAPVAAAAITMPSIVSAQRKLSAIGNDSEEGKELLQLGINLEEKVAEFKEAEARQNAAKARYEAICPPVPDILIAKQRHEHFISEVELDCLDNRVYRGTLGSQRRIIDSYGIKRSGCTAAQYQPHLKAALTYEDARSSAYVAAGVEAVRLARYHARNGLVEVAEAIARCAPVTMNGLAIKSKAMFEYSAIGADEATRAKWLFAESIANDVLRILNGGAVS